MNNYLPTEFHDFKKIFDELSINHGDENVFNDFLNWIVSNFSRTIKWQPLCAYKPCEARLFLNLFSEYINIIGPKLHKHLCYDFFGQYYEFILSNKHICEELGQFYTSKDTVMVNIRNGDTVFDPTCGSGRLLISAHVKEPGLILLGMDKSLTFCMMTVCNILVHGGVGEVVWRDSLNSDDWRKGWRINEHFPKTHTSGVREISKHESWF